VQPMDADLPPRLELFSISKRFPGVLANDNVSFVVRPGEIHALLGENGAGKSTLVKMIYGIMQPDAGEIHWNGEPVVVPNPRLRAGSASAWCSSISRCSRR
jgi:general nucleoside transport system ATP-binding protein